MISPAKKMNVDTDSMPIVKLPIYLEETQILMAYLQGLTFREAKQLWGCNDKIAIPTDGSEKWTDSGGLIL